MEEYEDDLGKIKISKTSFKRVREEGMWEKIEDQIVDPVIDEAGFKEVKELKKLPEAAPPIIKVKVKGTWRVIPFSNSDTCEEAFKKLNYQYHVFQENY